MAWGSKNKTKYKDSLSFLYFFFLKSSAAKVFSKTKQTFFSLEAHVAL
jgi:hypothetical protein